MKIIITSNSFDYGYDSIFVLILDSRFVKEKDNTPVTSFDTNNKEYSNIKIMLLQLH